MRRSGSPRGETPEQRFEELDGSILKAAEISAVDQDPVDHRPGEEVQNELGVQIGPQFPAGHGALEGLPEGSAARRHQAAMKIAWSSGVSGASRSWLR